HNRLTLLSTHVQPSPRHTKKVTTREGPNPSTEKDLPMTEFKKLAKNCLRISRLTLAFIALMQISFGPMVQNAKADDDHHKKTATPIRHVIVIVGENRTFDHIFATYKPKHGESVNNLLSEGIIKEDGSPGPNYARAHQYSA